eukprot:scaffold239485_cov33-Tisochrysis_lutea.AAC.3
MHGQLDRTCRECECVCAIRPRRALLLTSDISLDLVAWEDTSNNECYDCEPTANLKPHYSHSH